MMAALPSAFRLRSSTMSKKTTAKASKGTKAKPMLQMRKDAKGRFWVVAKDGGQEHGPHDTKQLATDAKAALASGATPATAKSKPAKAKKIKEPKAKKVSAIDAAAQVL